MYTFSIKVYDNINNNNNIQNKHYINTNLPNQTK